MAQLVERKAAQNIKAAKDGRLDDPGGRDARQVIHEHPRAQPRADRCTVTRPASPLPNADFDGDQMAVHLPLSAEAQAEARS
jgi:DNA-directed RNA polymerase subunit beta'